MKSKLLFSMLLVGLSFNVLAAGAKTLKVEKSIVIDAPASDVWAKVHNFDDLNGWHPAFKKTEIVSGTNNVKGAVRLLTLGDGGTIKEELLSYSDKKMSYQYKILEAVVPVSNYVSSITVKSQGANKTLVVWKGSFKRKDLSDKPAEGQDDATAHTLISGVYESGLANLKKISE